MQLDAATLNPLGATAVGGVERLAGQAGAAQNVESLREAALAFESLFTQMMLQSSQQVPIMGAAAAYQQL